MPNITDCINPHHQLIHKIGLLHQSNNIGAFAVDTFPSVVFFFYSPGLVSGLLCFEPDVNDEGTSR